MSKKKTKPVGKAVAISSDAVVRVDDCTRISRELLLSSGLWSAERHSPLVQKDPEDLAMLDCLLAMSNKLVTQRRYDLAELASAFPSVAPKAHDKILAILYAANRRAVHVCAF